VTGNRKFRETCLVVASHNEGKVREMCDLFKNLVPKLISAAELNLDEPDETGISFAENAEIKALAASKSSNLPSLADDSGLVVPALGGEPGIYSARWGGDDRNFDLAMERVNRELSNKSNREAHFVCSLSLAWPDDHLVTVEGRVFGQLVWPPKGDRGFGYDPIFKADGYKITFGEMDPAAKHKISHRADAFDKLMKICF
tara:strand:- start:1342 stop:1941 length:600 start_codon:yes stop_codon:yes gene_type:complete